MMTETLNIQYYNFELIMLVQLPYKEVLNNAINFWQKFWDASPVFYDRYLFLQISLGTFKIADEL